MKIKQIVIAVLLLNSLTGLKAGILSIERWMRGLHPMEYSCLGCTPSLESRFKALCYVETRLVDKQGVATVAGDEFLQDFLTAFETYSTNGLEDLLTAFITPTTKSNYKYVIAWFIRQRIDEGCDISALNDDMRYNFLIFWQSYSMISKTIEKAGSIDKADFEALTPAHLEEGHKRDYLDYPACLASLLQ